MPETGNTAPSRDCPTGLMRRFLVGRPFPGSSQLAIAYYKSLSRWLVERRQLTQLRTLSKSIRWPKLESSLVAGRNRIVPGLLIFIHSWKSSIDTVGPVSSSDKASGHVDASLKGGKSSIGGNQMKGMHPQFADWVDC